MEKRDTALLNGDTMKANELTEILTLSFGVEEISINEVYRIANQPMPRYFTETENNTYQRYSNDTVINGKDYTYMVITIRPKTTKSNLYKSGVAVVENKNPVVAGITTFLAVLTTDIIGKIPKVNTAYSIFDILFQTAQSVNTTSVINNIKTTYTWSATESATFAYLASEVINGMYIPIGNSNQVTANIIAVTPTMTDNRLSSFCIKGIQDQDVSTVKLKNPTQPVEVND